MAEVWYICTVVGDRVGPECPGLPMTASGVCLFPPGHREPGGIYKNRKERFRAWLRKDEWTSSLQGLEDAPESHELQSPPWSESSRGGAEGARTPRPSSAPNIRIPPASKAGVDPGSGMIPVPPRCLRTASPLTHLLLGPKRRKGIREEPLHSMRA